MSHPLTAKELLHRYNAEQLRAFKSSASDTLDLPTPSNMFGVAVSEHAHDRYEKKIISPEHEKSTHCVHVLSKNKEAMGFVWKTSAHNIKNAVRWGIVKPESVTGKVVRALGRYRVAAHERIIKGLQSNTQEAKLVLLELFQRRIESLQRFESLTNHSKHYADYHHVVRAYQQELKALQSELQTLLSPYETSGISPAMIKALQEDLQKDINEAYTYLFTLNPDYPSLNKAHQRARGASSVLEFVKSRMLTCVYQLQGMNQDITYSSSRAFALTRGDLNDCIEDALLEITTHEPDLCNAVTAKHHGDFSSMEKEGTVCYDFSDLGLSSTEEQNTLMAISFIEGWDTLEKGKLRDLQGHEASLKTIHASHWVTHKDWTSFFKRTGYYLANVFKSFLFTTFEHDVASFDNPDFQLYAHTLRQHASPHPSAWRKPYEFLVSLAQAVVDLFAGIYDFGKQLTIDLPLHLMDDWYRTEDVEGTLPIDDDSDAKTPFLSLLKQMDSTIENMASIEKDTLDHLLTSCHHKHPSTEATTPIARVDYPLSRGEYNDVLNASTRGLDTAGNVLSHYLYSYDPVSGLISSASLATGFAIMYYPAAAAPIIGKSGVGLYTRFAHTMGTSNLMGAMSVGTTQGQLLSTGWDVALKGPNSMLASTCYELGKNPLVAPAYVGVSYLVGRVLANGIAGHAIPWLSAYLQEDLGQYPDITYPFIGAKIAVMLYEALHAEDYHAYESNPINKAQFDDLKNLDENAKEQLLLTCWLSLQGPHLQKLSNRDKMALSQWIEKHFSRAQRRALNTLLYPEKPRSIAFQFFHVPLSYIPALTRFALSPFIAFTAWALGRTRHLEPVRASFFNLFDKVHYDLTRLYHVFNTSAHIVYNVMATHIKMLATLCAMLIGRIAGQLNIPLGHDMHQWFADTHNTTRDLKENLYPTSFMQTAQTAHPNHVFQKVEHSYQRMQRRLKGSLIQPEIKRAETNQSASLDCASQPQENGVKDNQSYYTSPQQPPNADKKFTCRVG